VRAVLPGSAAARAGLQVGERLAAIGDQPAPSQDLPFLLRRLWLQPGTEIGLDVLSLADQPSPARDWSRPIDLSELPGCPGDTGPRAHA
jgi:C-terminal processing protease CtpA/Prc